MTATATMTAAAMPDRPGRAPATVEVAGRHLPIAVTRRANARRLTLRLAPDGGEARVSLPPWGRIDEALAFARSRAAWLERQLAALPAAAPIGPGTTLGYRGERLAVLHDPAAPRRPEPSPGAIRLGGPAETVGPRLRRWLETEARRLFAEDLAHYCARAGVPPARLALSNARTRWGSCARRGEIRLNWRLVMAPNAARRSVVAHEVAHLVHFDHSRRFHAAVATLFEGDLAAANAWLKRHGRDLYAPFG